MHPAIPMGLVFVGCTSNVVFLELLVRDHPGCGNLITLSQFIFIALIGFIFSMKFGTKASVIPIKNYLLMVSMFFMVQVVNNYAFKFNISMTLHMIFRSGSLMANLILGVILLNKSYKTSKYMAVVLISVGICVCTIASAKDIQLESGSTDKSDEAMSEFVIWLIGLGMLLFALFLSARMGIFQETIYKKFGKHPSEALFYNHALPLPGFLLLASDISHHVSLFHQSDPVLVPVLDVMLPKMWIYLIGNLITQYVCIRGVFILTTECTSLTVTLVVTLRKFISLVFSILYFQNPFTIYHWVGSVCIFGGTLIFTEVIPLSYFDKKKKEQ